MQATTLLLSATLCASLFFSVCSSAQNEPVAMPPLRLTEAQMVPSAEGVLYEIALKTPLPAGSSVKLASQQIHRTQGFAYPLWLLDATIDLQQRTGQTQTLRIQTHRPNPSDQSEIMLAFSFDGFTRFVPIALMPDTRTRSTPRSPLPTASFEIPLLDNPRDAIANGVREANATTTVTPPSSPSTLTDPSAVRQNEYSIPSLTFPPKSISKIKPNPVKARPPAEVALTVTPIAPSTPSTPNTPNAPSTTTVTPLAAAADPEAPLPVQPSAAFSAPVAPTITPAQLTVLPPQKETLLWVIDVVIAGLLTYLAARLWVSKRHKRPAFNPNTQFQATDRGNTTNTVLGLTDEAAENIHNQWIHNQLSKRT